MLLGRLGATLLGNPLAKKGVIATSYRRGIDKKGQEINRAGEGIVRAGYGNKNNKMNF